MCKTGKVADGEKCTARKKAGASEKVGRNTYRRPHSLITIAMITETWWNEHSPPCQGGARGGGGMVLYVGMANRMVAELAMRRTVNTPFGDRHVNKRCVMNGNVQRLQVRICCG